MGDTNVSEKTIGYSLLILGLIAIFYSTFSVYTVFTGMNQPFNLFSFDAIKIDLSKFIIQSPSEAELTQDIVPSDVLNKPMNYIGHLMLMGFLASAGLKVATIGTTMLRPIKVKVTEQKKSVLEPN